MLDYELEEEIDHHTNYSMQVVTYIGSAQAIHTYLKC